jgi:hypothetical protein
MMRLYSSACGINLLVADVDDVDVEVVIIDVFVIADY